MGRTSTFIQSKQQTQIRMALHLNFFILASVLTLSQGRVQKTEVSFRGETFNVTSGCPSKNPEVLRWHEFCTVLWGDTTVAQIEDLVLKGTLFLNTRTSAMPCAMSPTARC